MARMRARRDVLAEHVRSPGRGGRTPARRDRPAAEQAERPLVAALDGAEQSAPRPRRSAEAEAAHRSTSGPPRWSARADALALALDEARARAGAERLAGVDGRARHAARPGRRGRGLGAGVRGGRRRRPRRRGGRRRRRAPAGRSRPCTGEAWAAPSWPWPPAGPAAPPRRSASRCAATCAVPDPASTACSTRSSARPWSSTAPGRRPSMSPWPIPTPSSSPATAIASAGTAGGWARPARPVPPAPRSTRPRRQAGDADHAVAVATARRAAAAQAVEEARRAEDDLSRQLDGNDGRLAAGGRRPAAGGDRPARRRHRGRGPPAPPRRARRPGRPGAGRLAELEATLPGLEAAEMAAAERGRAMAEARARLDERRPRSAPCAPTSRSRPPGSTSAGSSCSAASPRSRSA